MRKSIKSLLLASGAALMLSSCVSVTNMITDNPVGSKKGVAKLRIFGKDKDITLERAAKNGGVTKISLVEVRVTYFILPFVKTTVWGD